MTDHLVEFIFMFMRIVFLTVDIYSIVDNQTEETNRFHSQSCGIPYRQE